MNKMYLIGSYNKTPLKVNESAKKEYERLRSEHLFKSQSHLEVTETSITIKYFLKEITCFGYCNGWLLVGEWYIMSNRDTMWGGQWHFDY